MKKNMNTILINKGEFKLLARKTKMLKLSMENFWIKFVKQFADPETWKPKSEPQFQENMDNPYQVSVKFLQINE